MQAINKNINKYLKNYAEPEVTSLVSFPENVSCSNVVVIPAYKEDTEFIERFITSPLSQEKALMIVVINQPQSNNDTFPQQLLFNSARSQGTTLWQYGNLTLIQLSGCNSQLLVVDRFTCKIPDEQGVGLARKIGCDLALSLITSRNIHSDFIFSTDCDATLPDDYFASKVDTINKHRGKNTTVALCFNFHHQSDCMVVSDANQQYEQALRYYVDGLKYANSSYAFFTIGSILAFSANAYAMVRGFPKRSAGEDFYLLNKLAKLGNIDFIETTCLNIEARTSDRVPFGTGPAVSKIIELNNNNEVYCYYHPEVFLYLKKCLSAFSSLWEKRFEFDAWLASQPDINQTVLLSIGFKHFFVKNMNNNEQQFNKQLNVWFDAFKTLKFIHALRNEGLDDIPLQEAKKILSAMI